MTTALIHWVRSRGSKWHGWEEGWKMTLCGRLTVLHLHNGERLDVDDSKGTTEHYHELCSQCRHHARVRPPQSADEVVRAWEGLVGLHIQTAAPGAIGSGRRAAMRSLATYLAELGPPLSLDGEAGWREIRPLLLVPWAERIKDFSLAVAKLTPGALVRVASAIRTWRRITGRCLSMDRYHADRVVEVILQIPDVESYVRHLKGRGLEHLAAVFHPNTLARARKESGLRGTFSGGGAYWETAQQHLTIVE